MLVVIIILNFNLTCDIAVVIFEFGSTLLISFGFPCNLPNYHFTMLYQAVLMYTVFQKKNSHFVFGHNFCK